MAGGRSDIKAGSAFVELWVKKSAFMKALDDAQKRLHAFGTSMLNIGAKITTAGMGILASMAAAGLSFAAAGDKLDKMSNRVGVSVEKLSALKFAAEQTGANVDILEKGFAGLSRTLFQAQRGSAAAVESLNRLGLTVEDLEKLSPDEQFSAIATGISNLSSASEKGAIAQQLFGRAGRELLPMLDGAKGGIDELMAEAERLGITLTTEDATAAAKLTDALNRMKSTLMGIVNQVGGAVAPVMEEMANNIAKVAGRVIKFVKENRTLIITVGKVAAVVAGVGSAIMGIGVMFIGAGAAISGFMAVVSGVASAIGLAGSLLAALGATIGVVLSPVGLLVAAVIAAGVAFFDWRKAAEGAVNGLVERVGSVLGSLRKTFGAAFDGIRDAIAGGDLALAGEIAMTTLRLVFMQGLESLSQMVGGTMGDMLASLGSKILDGDFAGAWNTVVLGMQAVWEEFANGMVETFVGVATTLVETWRTTLDEITSGILEASSKSKALSDALQVAGGLATGDVEDAILGPSVKGELDREERLNSQLKAKGLNAESDAIFDDVRSGTFTAPETQAAADRMNQQLADMARKARESAKEAGDAFREDVAGGASEASDAVLSLQKQLEELKAEAKRKREEAARGEDGDDDDDGGSTTSSKGGKASIATFSAHGAMAMAQRSFNPQDAILERQARIAKRQERLAEKQLEKADMMIGEIRNNRLIHP